MKKKILVTGGSGMVGSELKLLLPNASFPTSQDLNLTSQKSVNSYLENNQFTHIIHLAAYVGSLHDNIKNRINYYDQNVLMNTILTKSAFESGIENFLGILSTCIYPASGVEFPMKEDDLHNGKPHESLMSYSYAKRAHAVQLDNYRLTHGINYNYLIPCNLYGKPKVAHLERQHFINDLVMKIYRAKRDKTDLTLFGDGTPLRQFMHAKDLARVIYKYVDGNMSASFNVAPEHNLAINEYVDIAMKTLQIKNMRVVYDTSQPNGQFRKDVCCNLFRHYFDSFEFSDLTDGVLELYQSYEKLL
jgi:GDP-L-fucose synthase